jgi:hypothetical protein
VVQALVLAELCLELYLAPVRDSLVERRLVQSLAAAQDRASGSARCRERVELVGLPDFAHRAELQFLTIEVVLKVAIPLKKLRCDVRVLAGLSYVRNSLPEFELKHQSPCPQAHASRFVGTKILRS